MRKLKKQKNQINLSNTFSYLVELLLELREGKKLSVNKINWMGGRHTGKTANALIFILLAIIMNPDKTFKVYLIRKSKINKKEVLEDIWGLIPYHFKKIWNKNEVNKTIIGKNFKINCKGLKAYNSDNREHVGASRVKSDICIVLYDECFELTKKNISDVEFSIGGYTEIIEFFCSNPWDITCFFFDRIQKIIPWNEEIMKTKGEQFMIDYKHNELFHWTNILKTYSDGYLSPNIYNKIINAPEKYGAIGEVIAYGAPAVIEGAVFDMSKVITLTKEQLIEKSIFQSPTIIFGVDFGYTKNPTFVSFGIVSNDFKNVCLLDELKIDHKNIPYDARFEATKVIRFVNNKLREYFSDLGNEMIYVYCDSENLTMKSMLNNLNKNNNVEYLGVQKMKKNLRLPKRIQKWNSALSNSNVFVLENKCKLIIQSMSSLVYYYKNKGAVNTLTIDPAIGWDDAYDSITYGLSIMMLNGYFGNTELIK